MMAHVIQAQHLSKRFVIHYERPRALHELLASLVSGRRSEGEEFWAIRDVSFQVQEGEMLGVVGRNGAGKSTLLKLIARVLDPTDGLITVRGRVGALLELGTGFHSDLSGRENVFLNGTLLGLTQREIARRMDEIVAFAELEQFIDVPLRSYSSGMQMRLGFSVAVHTEPEILLVDEVLAVGDAGFQHKCLDRIASLRHSGVTILLVSHDLGTIQSLCDSAIWLHDARIEAQGQPTDVVMAYLNEVARKEQEETAAQPHPVMRDDQRWGTGRIRITNVELCDGNGASCSTFVNGGPMEVRMSYRAEQTVEDPNFGLAIYHQNGTHICGPNTHFGGLYIPSVCGEGQVVYHIPSLELLEGTYLLSVAVVNGADTETYDYHDRAYGFRVYPGRSRERYGVVTLNGSWRMEEPSEVSAT